MDDESRPLIAEESRPLAAISDDDLLRRLAEILTQSRRVEKDLVAHVAEVDERRLYAREAFPSMFPTARRPCTSRNPRPTCASPWPEPRGSTP